MYRGDLEVMLNLYWALKDVYSIKAPTHGFGSILQTKGEKEGSCGKMAHFHVGIANNKGVVLCKQYHKTLSGKRFKEFVTQHFP